MEQQLLSTTNTPLRQTPEEHLRAMLKLDALPQRIGGATVVRSGSKKDTALDMIRRARTGVLLVEPSWSASRETALHNRRYGLLCTTIYQPTQCMMRLTRAMKDKKRIWMFSFSLADHRVPSTEVADEWLRVIFGDWTAFLMQDRSASRTVLHYHLLSGADWLSLDS